MIEHQKHSNLFNSSNRKIEILILSIRNKTALTAVTVNRIINSGKTESGNCCKLSNG